MENNDVLLAPTSSIAWADGLTNLEFGNDLVIGPLSPELRGRLLRQVKDFNPKDHNRYDRIISEIQEADAVIWAPFPQTDWSQSKAKFGEAFLYYGIVDHILFRLLECSLLFADASFRYQPSLWFVAEGRPSEFQADTLRLINSAWEPTFQLAREGGLPGEEKVHARALADVARNWKKLATVAQVDSIRSCYTDKSKQDMYVKKANAYIKEKSLELAQAHADEHGDSENAPFNMKVPKTLIAEWFMFAYARALGEDLRSISKHVSGDRADRRFARSFHIFVQSCRLDFPFSLVGYATCLESLLCTSVVYHN